MAALTLRSPCSILQLRGSIHESSMLTAFHSYPLIPVFPRDVTFSEDLSLILIAQSSSTLCSEWLQTSFTNLQGNFICQFRLLFSKTVIYWYDLHFLRCVECLHSYSKVSIYLVCQYWRNQSNPYSVKEGTSKQRSWSSNMHRVSCIAQPQVNTKIPRGLGKSLHSRFYMSMYD